MIGIERQYLRACIKAICNARFELLKLTCDEAVQVPSYGKSDSLMLDATPEIEIYRTLCEEFDPHLPLITEEIGNSLKLSGNEDELVCFCDPLDRSKVFRSFIEKKRGRLDCVLQEKKNIEEWEEKNGGDIELTGPYGSISGIRHGEILFSVMINYITGTLYIASEGLIGSTPFSSLFEDTKKRQMVRTTKLFESVTPCRFDSNNTEIDDDIATQFVAYCKGEKYKSNLSYSKVLGHADIERIIKENLMDDRVGGPARILYLLRPSRVGFIMANGEKISEWLGWLAYVKYSSPNLLAYELSFDSSWTREGILMAPSNAYSVLGDNTYQVAGQKYKDFKIDLQKLRYLRNPSHYRGTIVVCSATNRRLINAMIVGNGTRLSF